MPTTQELRLSPIPAELRDLPNWVVWRLEPRGGKMTKVPYDPKSGKKAKAGQPATWGSFSQALAAMEKYDGVGFQFDGNHFGIDIDHCIDPDTGEIDPKASRIVQDMGSYAELSPSGTGIHILCAGQLPTEGNKGKRKGAFEFYGQGRYFTVTGTPYGGPRPLVDGSEAVKRVMAGIFGKDLQANTSSLPAQQPTTLLLHEALEKAFQSKKNGPAIKALYDGDTAGYPSHSEADQALCNHLAFWCQKDAALMDEAFRGSGLMRGKWDEVHDGKRTYGEMTIEKAIAGCASVYDPQRKRAAQDHKRRFQEHQSREANAAPDEAEGLFAKYAELYEHTTDRYMSERGETFEIDKDGGAKPLANFTCVPTAERTRDDGVEKTKEYVMEGVNARGETLPPIAVPTKAFAGMNWVTEGWGLMANIAPGSTIKDKLRHAINQVGASTARRQTVFTHTGWRNIGGKWVYLHEGGAVGSQDVQTELQDVLKRYTLDASDLPAIECAQASRQLLSSISPKISYPLLAFQYLAPLREFMPYAPPAFALALIGTSNTGKSTIASLFLSHYGKGFHQKANPVSFEATANALGALAFYVKDSVLLVDDYHPISDPRAKRAMEAKADALSRGSGDGASRTRLTSEAKIKESKPPRALVIITGEDVPQLSPSGAARYFNIDVKRGDLPIGNPNDDTLTILQRQARQGVYSQAMRSYIEHLAKKAQAGGLEERLQASFEVHRRKAGLALRGEFQRLVEAVAHLCVGLEVVTEYWVEIGLLTDGEAQQIVSTGFSAFCEGMRSQGQDLRAADPVEQFISVLKELDAAGQVRIQPLKDPPFGLVPGIIGYRDEQFYYLFPGLSYNAVNDMLKGQSGGLSVSQRGLGRHMAERGLLRKGTSGNTIQRRIPGLDKPQWFWWVHASAFDAAPSEEIPATAHKDAAATTFEEVVDL